MFALRPRYLRRRLSRPTSGSERRREEQRRHAEEGRIARERVELIVRQGLEQQHMTRDQLSSYEPWGRAGGGAPNPRSIRRMDLRAEGLFPEDELKGMSQYEVCGPLGPAGVRVRRHHQQHHQAAADAQTHYRETLDEMVHKKKRAEKEDLKRNLEYERKMQNMVGPWGRPGPGGTVWRNPRDIGLNFNKSMGWTTNETFREMQGERHNQKRSSLTLPKVKRDDDAKRDSQHKENKSLEQDKLPDINHTNGSSKSRQNSGENKTGNKTLDNEKVMEKSAATVEHRSKRSQKKKGTFVKRLPNGERVKRVVLEESSSDEVQEKKPTPETAILRLTGGIELVPLLGRKRRVGARTLHSSDVTRCPDQPCQYVSRPTLPLQNATPTLHTGDRWREISSTNAEYLRDLKNQVQAKYVLKEESRKNSAECARRHHATWASLWGRPGHGAPHLPPQAPQQRGRYARSNLARLLYVTPLAHTVGQRFY